MNKPPKKTTADETLLLYPELSASQIRTVQRRLRAGELSRIAAGIVTNRPLEEWPALVARERIRVLAAMFPGAVIGYRIALEGGVPAAGVMYLSANYQRKLSLPGLVVQLMPGSGKSPGDAPMMGRELYFPSTPRLLLENLTVSRGKVRKSAGKAAVEARLISICEARGEDALVLLREEARILAPALQLKREFPVLDGLVAGVLGSPGGVQAGTQRWMGQPDVDCWRSGSEPAESSPCGPNAGASRGPARGIQDLGQWRLQHRIRGATACPRNVGRRFKNAVDRPGRHGAGADGHACCLRSAPVHRRHRTPGAPGHAEGTAAPLA